MDLDKLCAELYPVSEVTVQELPHPEAGRLYAPVLRMNVAKWFLDEFGRSRGGVSADSLWSYFQSRHLDALAGETAYGAVFGLLVEDEQARTALTEEGLFIVVGSYTKR